jgi:outer membrane lipoprotein SlyB
MKPRTISTVLIVLLLSGCTGRNATEIGTANGALLGAATGAAIGNQQNNALAGAIIGASTGAIAGNVIGGQVDRRNESYETKFRADQQVLRERVDKNAVTLDQVLQMSAALVSDEVIVNEINSRGSAAPLTIDEIIYLSKQNVSPEVIKGYQNASSRAQSPNDSPPYLSGNEVGTVELGRRYHDHSPHYNESTPVRRRSGFYFGIGN